MKESDIILRTASPDDAASLLEIYSHYVLHTAVSFEYDVPTVGEFTQRITNTLARYPYIIAEKNGKAVGYAYASSFHTRKAYSHSAEVSIYVRDGCLHGGIGKLLYTALENILSEMNIFNLYACIGYPQTEDEYLTKNSADFHEHLGYRFIGEFCRCGYKFGRWYNIIWMEKLIGEHPDSPAEVLPFCNVKNIIREKYNIQ